MTVDTLKEPLESSIAPIEVDPLRNGQAKDDIVLRFDQLKQLVAFWHVVALYERDVAGESSGHGGAARAGNRAIH